MLEGEKEVGVVWIEKEVNNEIHIEESDNIKWYKGVMLKYRNGLKRFKWNWDGLGGEIFK